MGQPCSSCDEGAINLGMVLVCFVLFLIVASIIISGALGVMREHGIVTDARLIIGFYQVRANMSQLDWYLWRNDLISV